MIKFKKKLLFNEVPNRERKFSFSSGSTKESHRWSFRYESFMTNLYFI